MFLTVSHWAARQHTHPLQLAPGRMLVCARSKLWWMTPEWRTGTANLPPETQFVLVGVWCVVLAAPAAGPVLIRVSSFSCGQGVMSQICCQGYWALAVWPVGHGVQWNCTGGYDCFCSVA